MKARTSTSHPIRVDWFVTDHGPGKGRLGITFLPGKRGASAYGAPWERDLAADLDRLRDEFRVDLLVSLVEEHERVDFGVPTYPHEAELRGIAVLQIPVVDGTPPTLEQAVTGVSAALALARSGRHAVFHCRGGLGRAGTFAACALVAGGSPPDDAIAAVRVVRPGAIENARQEAFVRAFDRARRGAT